MKGIWVTFSVNFLSKRIMDNHFELHFNKSGYNGATFGFFACPISDDRKEILIGVTKVEKK